MAGAGRSKFGAHDSHRADSWRSARAAGRRHGRRGPTRRSGLGFRRSPSASPGRWRSPTRLPMAIGVLDARAVRTAQPTLGLDEALSRIPGVVVLNRYNYSLDQRISLRGAGSRANFGLRGVKVLIDGVPQTLPDGQSQLTNLDLGMIDRVEVLTGSAGALYGNASGGVLVLHDRDSPAALDRPTPDRRWQLRNLEGSIRTGNPAGTIPRAGFALPVRHRRVPPAQRRIGLAIQREARGRPEWSLDSRGFAWRSPTHPRPNIPAR